MHQAEAMDTKVSFAILAVVATLLLILAKTNGNGKGLVVLNRPFFSSNLQKSKAFKDIHVVEATEKTTDTTNSKAASKTSTNNITRTFTCMSQQDDIKATDKSTPITLHEAAVTTPSQASTSNSLNNPTVVSTGVYNASSPAGTGRATTSGTGCPSGYTKQLNDYCYKFVDSGSGANRSAARSACQDDSAHLVFIETKEENDFLVGEAQSNTQYWIGIHERPNLFWDNGNNVTFANIDPHNFRTFNDDTGCYRMSDNDERHWFDTSCSTKLRYICEYEGTDCPSGYTKQFNDSCYKFVDSGSKANRSAARSACKNDSAHLVFIETKEENDFLVGEAESNTQYWIGIHERPNLFWDNGNHVTFANIDPDNKYTFNDDTGCYRLSRKGKRYWFDTFCATKLRYICEYEGTDCPSGYIKQFNDSCYKFADSGSGANRSAARSACESDSAHLVFIETREENDFLVGEAESNTQYWIGIHERPNLFWDNGNHVTFANIDPDNFPTSKGDTGCYRMSDNDERHWLNAECSASYGYICEY